MDLSDNEDFEGTPPEVLQSAVEAKSNLIPEKSRFQYDSAYKQFKEWCQKKNICRITENVLLAYLEEKSKAVKSSTLWSLYSMLRTTLNINDNIDIRRFSRLVPYLKKKSVGYRPKKSQILTRPQIDRFMVEADDVDYLMMKVNFAEI